MVKNFKEIYEYLASRFYSNPCYSIKKTIQNIKMIQNFIDSSVIQTEEELWRYLLFQFVLAESKRKNEYHLTISNCVSKNAIKRWEDRTDEMMFLVAKFQRERGLRNPLIKDTHVYNQKYLDYQRKKFFNTPRGFILCGEYEGLLYHSIKCNGCQYKKACEKSN